MTTAEMFTIGQLARRTGVPLASTEGSRDGLPAGPAVPVIMTA